MQVLPCIGEKLEEREAGKTEEVCFGQLKTIADRRSRSKERPSQLLEELTFKLRK